MSRIFLVFFVIYFWHLSSAMASTINLRSGDHDGFTRLVMQLPANVQWETTSKVGQQTISFLGHEDGFDVSGIFEIIPRDRLTDVRTHPSKIELQLACDCEVKLFVEKGNYLVIDVIDGPPLSLEQSVIAPSPLEVRLQSTFAYGELLWPDADVVDTETELAVAQPKNRKGDGTPESTPDDILVETTRSKLLRSVANAASRGVLLPAIPQLDEPDVNTEDLTVVEIFDSSELEVVQSPPQGGNIRITTSRDIPSNRSDLDLDTFGNSCPSERSVQVSSWGNSTPFHEQVSSIRENLYLETDRLNEEKVIELAKLYIYFGFGVEAKEVLRLSDRLVESSPELMDLADIVDYGFARNPRFIHRFTDCDSDLSLWAIMAAKTVPADQFVNEDAALRALSKLPSHLKGVIAPALSERFLELGKTDAALIALRRLDIASVENSSPAELVRAKITRNNGNFESADSVFLELAHRGEIESPEALVEFVNNRAKTSTPIDADLSLLIDAYAFELRDSAISSDFYRTTVLGYALSGQYDRAFDFLSDGNENVDPARRAMLQSDVFSALAKNATDVKFLEKVIYSFPEDLEDIELHSVFSVADRLLKLGFSEQSYDILAKVSENRKDQRTIILEAKALLYLGDATKAVRRLEGQVGRLADELRAQAFLVLGENERAAELFREIGLIVPAERASWLSESWVNSISEQAEIFGGIRDLTQDALEQVAVEDGMLNATMIALEQSASARDIVTELLENVPISP